MKRLFLILGIFLFLTISADAASRFGVCTVTCTWDNASTAMWSTSSGGTIGASVPGSSDDVIFDGATCVGGVTCTITLNFGGPITILSLSMGSCTASTTGCIFDNSVNNNNITMTAATTASFNISGGGTRTIKLGSATYELSGASATFTAQTASGMTFQAGTSTIYMSGTLSRTFRGGDRTYATFRNGAMSPTGVLVVTNSNTFANFRIDPPSFIEITTGENTTITNSVDWNGSVSAKITLSTTNNVAVANWSFPASQTLTYVALRGMNVTSGSPTANNSFDLKNNTGITINAPAASSGGGGCILGGWLLWRDLPEHINDNFPAWLEKAT